MSARRVHRLAIRSGIRAAGSGVVLVHMALTYRVRTVTTRKSRNRSSSALTTHPLVLTGYLPLGDKTAGSWHEPSPPPWDRKRSLVASTGEPCGAAGT
jgi:hypothetical protein